jgi:hypothetical protein
LTKRMYVATKPTKVRARRRGVSNTQINSTPALLYGRGRRVRKGGGREEGRRKGGRKGGGRQGGREGVEAYR